MTPTVYLVVGGSAIARDVHGEVLEAVDYDEHGVPDWTEANIVDDRGGGYREPLDALIEALDACERNAMLLGHEIVRVPAATPI